MGNNFGNKNDIKNFQFVEFTGIPLKKKLLVMTFQYGEKFTGPR